MTAYNAVIDVIVSVFNIPHDKYMNNLILECHNNGTVVIFENTEEECNKIQKQAQEYYASRPNIRDFYQDLRFEVLPA